MSFHHDTFYGASYGAHLDYNNLSKFPNCGGARKDPQLLNFRRGGPDVYTTGRGRILYRSNINQNSRRNVLGESAESNIVISSKNIHKEMDVLHEILNGAKNLNDL